MFGVLAEDDSDADTLTVLIRRLAARDNLKIKSFGFEGGSQLLKDGASKVKLFHDMGVRQFIVCHDADEMDCDARRQQINDAIIKRAAVDGIFCALVPKQEIESWILADVSAVSRVISSFRTNQSFQSPENIKDPKEVLRRMSRVNAKPRFNHATHNAKVAKFLDLNIVEKKCPSFVPLKRAVQSREGNCQLCS